MKNSVDCRKHVNLSLGFDNNLIEIPLEIPCHSYAMGIIYDYHIGEFIETLVDSYTSDTDFIDILSKELKLMNLAMLDIDYSKLSEIILTKRVIQITRMDTPCRDYHFYLYHPNGTISHKYRYSEPTYSSNLELVRGEYSLGIYSIEWAL